MLKARLFGGLSVEIDGRRVPSIPGFKARSLFAYLVLHPGPHPRIRLAGMFWPDVLDASARGSLPGAPRTGRRAPPGPPGARAPPPPPPAGGPAPPPPPPPHPPPHPAPPA